MESEDEILKKRARERRTMHNRQQMELWLSFVILGGIIAIKKVNMLAISMVMVIHRQNEAKARKTGQ